MELTKEQRSYLTHMLGAEKHIHKQNWGYRNRYCAPVGSKDEADLKAMEEIGLVKRSHTINDGRDVYFVVTEAGMDAIGLNKKQKANAMEE